jgi:hypothetical protein
LSPLIATTRIKIVHKSRGKYRIVEDTKKGYVNRIIDASDVMQVK